MIRLFPIMILAIALTSCGNGKKKEEVPFMKYSGPIDNATRNQEFYERGIKEGTHYRDKDGNVWSEDNIFAPGPAGSIHDNSYRSVGSSKRNQYKKGYEDGYNAAKSEYEND